MDNEMCPSCGEIREMKRSTSVRTITQTNGEKKEIVTLSFSCAKCSQFVRSEDHDKLAKDSL